MRKYIVPAAESVGADLLEFGAPDIAKVVSGRKKFKTASKIAGRQTLRKQFGGGRRKRTENRVFRTKTATHASRS